MNPRKEFFSKKPWLQGGIMGVIVCILLFLFYIFMYLPAIHEIYAEEIAEYGGAPSWTTNVMMVTGHFFPILSGFIVPYGFLCKPTVPVCTYWSAEYEPGGVLWMMEGQPGYCIEQIMTPANSCANLSETVGFLGLASLLLVVYFVIGAIIGELIQKRKAK